MKDGSTAPSKDVFVGDQVRFGAALAVLAAAGIALVLLVSPPPVNIEEPVRAVQQRLKQRHLDRAGKILEKTCRRKDCDCAGTALHAGLDADAGKEVVRLLEAAKECDLPNRDGMRAEALIRAGSTASGVSLTNTVLRGARTDPYALQAQALAAYRIGARTEARDIAKEAVATGRGAPAHQLLGVVQLDLGALDDARRELEAALAAEPEDIDTRYDLALLATRQNRFGEARKLYLGVLRAAPDHRQARYNLALLLHSAGAVGEAQHHLRKLEAVAPGDPLVLALKGQLAQPPPHPAAQILSLGGPGSAAEQAP